VFDLINVLNQQVYAVGKEQKNDLFSQAIGDLTRKHYAGCPEYRKILDMMAFDAMEKVQVDQFPFLPVRLFKEYELLSVPRQEIVKTMTSSGTTGQQVSRICLDRETSNNQTKALVKIVSSFLGAQRLPMLIIDSPTVIKDRNLFSARGAGILGFSMLGRDHTYALDEQMEIDMKAVTAFLDRHRGESIMVFGFTFMLWEHFLSRLKVQNVKLDVRGGIIIHGGGWKKLLEKAVDNATFKQVANELCGISQVYNYYGMVEQTGSIFMECDEGHLHAPLFSDVIIRNPRDFKTVEYGEHGLIQLLSLLPGSYPGHSILSEDLGEIIGADTCPCGRKGKYFKVHGRIQNAEVRGCSDVYASGRN
jgi:phenylacetate-coenzyme A ligase PaaK-like adenylate-forming protein